MSITQPVVRGTLEREIYLRAIEDDSPVSIWSLVLEWMEHKDREVEMLSRYLEACSCCGDEEDSTP